MSKPIRKVVHLTSVVPRYDTRIFIKRRKSLVLNDSRKSQFYSKILC